MFVTEREEKRIDRDRERERHCYLKAMHMS